MPGHSSTSVPETPRGNPLWWRLAVVAGLAWFGFLLTMVLIGANPPTLNVAQIEYSVAVIEGQIQDLNTGKVKVLQVRRGTLTATEVHLENLEATGGTSGGTYLFPLIPADNSGEFEVTLIPPQSENSLGTPLIYPVTTSTLQQLSEIPQKAGR